MININIVFDHNKEWFVKLAEIFISTVVLPITAELPMFHYYEQMYIWECVVQWSNG